MIFKNRKLDFDSRSHLMGILNVTPDSFSDGGEFYSVDKAVDHAQEMLRDGATIIDIGGESTRPGSIELTCEEEISRVVPVITLLREREPNCIISIDTRKADVARSAVEAGADIINDISGLQFSKEIADVAAETQAGLILMHMRGTPQTMQNQDNLEYTDVVEEIKSFLKEATDYAISRGVKPESLALDPGIGFAKTTEQNLDILRRLDELKELGLPLLLGHSRKSFIGKTLEIDAPQERIWGTLGVSTYLAQKQIEILRVHDVKANAQAIAMFNLCFEES